MKTKGKIFIIGKILGIPQPELSEKFQSAETMLSARGFQVVNPIKITDNLGLNEKNERQLRLGALSECGHVYLLSCSVDCEVAQKEIDFAVKENLEIHYELENIEVNEPTEIIHGKEQKL